jgi:hypothetical protein
MAGGSLLVSAAILLAAGVYSAVAGLAIVSSALLFGLSWPRS